MTNYFGADKNEEMEDNITNNDNNNNNNNNNEDDLDFEEIQRPEVDVEELDNSNDFRNLDEEEEEANEDNNLPETFEDHLSLIKPGFLKLNLFKFLKWDLIICFCF
jgi:hypothetical protein